MTRAERRYKHAIKLARRYRIITATRPQVEPEWMAPLTPRARHWHLRCNCFECRPNRARRRLEERAWRNRELA